MAFISWSHDYDPLPGYIVAKLPSTPSAVTGIMLPKNFNNEFQLPILFLDSSHVNYTNQWIQQQCFELDLLAFPNKF